MALLALKNRFMNFKAVVGTPTNLETVHLELEETAFQVYNLKLTSSNDGEPWVCSPESITRQHIDALIESRKDNLRKEILAIETAYRQLKKG